MVDWGWDLLRSFIGAGAGTAAVTGGLALLRERTKKRGEATYLALRLAVTLEAFAGACSDLITENRYAEAPPGQPFPYWRSALPPLADYPSDGDGWKGIDIKLSAAALNFRNEVAAGQASIKLRTAEAEWDIEWEVRTEALRLGRSAHSIAMQMREAYRLPTIPSSYAYVSKLDEAKVQFDEEEETRRLRLESFHAARATASN